MVLVVALLVETFPTVLAGIRFVVKMDSHVGVQSRATIKSFAACLTFVGLF